MNLTAATGPPLNSAMRPEFQDGGQRVRVVDLFAGCGGLTLGLAQAAHTQGVATEVVLAADSNGPALEVFSSNFPKAATTDALVEQLLGGELGDEVSVVEQALREKLGAVDVLVGGPPCQGHSNLNNRTRRVDPKNALYLKMVRAAEVFKPQIVLIENVPAVQHSIPDVVGIANQSFTAHGYSVAQGVVAIDRLGVPQRRKRHVLLAVTETIPVSAQDVFQNALKCELPPMDVRAAIRDLQETSERGVFDQVPRASSTNVGRMNWLLDNGEYDLPNRLRPPCHQGGGHSYKSMYGRLRWDEPAQTVTSGFTSIGQGRYMHPELPRALTAHEAARLQGFPDYYDFSSVKSKTELSTMIGNAVPPALSRVMLQSLIGLVAS